MRSIILQLILLCGFSGYCLASGSNIENITVQKGNIYYHIKGLEKPFKVVFISDSHITIEDERGKPYYSFAKRMGGSAVEPQNYGKSNGRDKTLVASLDKASENGAELVILAGDIINFPSPASVELILDIMNRYQMPWVFTAGNHDWHYEGEAGTSSELRDKWTKKSLVPLYQDQNPMFNSQILNGINFVTIDNSTFEISKEQLAFFKEQTKRKYPIVLAMHIPLYLPGHEDSTGDYGCANPNWKAANDKYYKLEKRLPWAENGHTKTTFEFKDLVFGSSKVIGVFAGHTHSEKIDFYNGKPQFVAGNNFNGNDITIHFVPFE